jgi:hypothetical protein
MYATVTTRAPSGTFGKVGAPGDRRGGRRNQAVVAKFRKLVGSRFYARNKGKQIVLDGEEIRQVLEEDEAYTSVDLSGFVPGSIAPGTYYCKYVHYLVPGRGWVLVFENLHLSIRVVDGLSGHREKEKGRIFLPCGSWVERAREPSASARPLDHLHLDLRLLSAW